MKSIRGILGACGIAILAMGVMGCLGNNSGPANATQQQQSVGAGGNQGSGAVTAATGSLGSSGTTGSTGNMGPNGNPSSNSSTPTPASVTPATVIDVINGLYVGIYSAAATQAGIQYWVSQLNAFDNSITQGNAAITVISSADAAYLGGQFAQTALFQSRYGNMTDAQYTQNLYSGIGGFAISSTSELQYWQTLIQQTESANGGNVAQARGSVAGQFIDALLSNSLSDGAKALGLSSTDYSAVVKDQLTILFKVEVSKDYAQLAVGSQMNYTITSGTAFANAQIVIAGVTFDPATVITAENTITAMAANDTPTPATATPTTVVAQINGLYAGLYAVAATQTGIQYWVSQLNEFDPSITQTNATTTAISAADAAWLGKQFAQAALFQNMYGSLSDAQFVQALYSEIGGYGISDTFYLQYWQNMLQSAESANGGNVSQARGSIASQFIDAMLSNDLTVVPSTSISAADYTAVVEDQLTLQNKVAVSEFYAQESTLDNGLLNYTSTSGPAFDEAQAVITSVSYSASSVTTVENAISAIIQSDKLP